MKRFWGLYAQITGAAFLATGWVFAAETAGTIQLDLTNGTKHIALPKVSGVDEFKVLRSTNLTEGFKEVAPGVLSGYNWQQPGQGGLEFFKLEMTPKSPQAVQSVNLLNRIAYGPTPDELERLTQIGPDAYIREQLTPELIEENLAVDRVINLGEWQYVTLTAAATPGNRIYIYTTAAGDCYLDDLKLVRGSVAESGANLIANGDFEAGLTGWTVSTNLTNSAVVTDIKHSGNSSLHVVAEARGEGQTTSIWRSDFSLTVDETVTLSYWVRAGTNLTTLPLLIRLAGAGENNGTVNSVAQSSFGSFARTKLANGTAILNDLAAWHSLHAVQSKKQLLEVVLQFLENHFVTQQTKSRDYFDRYYDGTEMDTQATNLEYRELQRWRQALLSPQCTFYDLLKISAESPAQIIYLDTVNSKGNSGNVANENYARELLELFTYGVDNGYDQNDITIMSRAWTGWSIRLVDQTNEFNPFAPQSQTLRPNGTNKNTINNLEGIWGFGYKPGNHYNGEKIIFPGKTVPDRFGAPYAGRNYELKLPPSGRTGTNWIYVTHTAQNSAATTAGDIYVYINGAGDCYLDDLKLVAGTVAEAGPNLIPGGEFDNDLAGWTISSAVRSSAISTDIKKVGAGALHVISTTNGTGRATSLWRTTGAGPTNTYTLSYWYRPGSAMTGDFTIRFSGSDNGNNLFSTPSGVEGLQDGYKVIQHLADQPFTQEYICVKLCRLLVHDDFAHGYDFTDPNLSPEGQLVRACMQAWESGSPKGQIRKVLEVILNSELFRSQAASMQKVKTPFEFTVSAVRALRAQLTDGTYTANTDANNGVRTPISRMGRMRLFDREEPDGWPEAGAPWISAGTLTERLKFVQSMLLPTPGTDASGNNANPVRLLKAKLPQSAWTDGAAVADYFVGILYPGEGRANLDEYRQTAVWYLNTANNGTTASAFSSLDPNGAANGPYDQRVRGMVAMLMTFPRFQEQ